jgi:RNA polymerase sigma-70 factor (ECF subfamily)
MVWMSANPEWILDPGPTERRGLGPHTLGGNTPSDCAGLEDDALIRLVVVGKAEALSTLYDRYVRMIFGLAFNTVGDEQLAEEITQDVFIRIWEKASSYRAEQGKVLNWIASIARYRAIDLFRRRNVRPEGHSISWADAEPLMLSDVVDVENEVELSQRKQEVRRAMRKLPTEQRQALALAYFRGLSQQEIAVELHQPLGTIKTRIRLGMQKLRPLLESEDS